MGRSWRACALALGIAASCGGAAGNVDPCAVAVEAGRADAPWTCRAQFEVSGDAATGARAARALADGGGDVAVIEAIARRIGDSAAGAEAWNAVGDARRVRNDDARSIEAYARALAHRAETDLAGRIRDAVGLYNRYGHGNQFRLAMQYSALAYELSRRLGDPYLRAYVLTGVAGTLLDLGDLPAAEALVDEADHVLDADSPFWPLLRNLHAGLDYARGRYQLAAAELVDTAAAARKAELDHLAVTSTLNLVDAQLEQGDAAAAARTFASLAPLRGGEPEARAWRATLAAKVALARGDLALAVHITDDALADHPGDWTATLEGVRGRALRGQGLASEAEAALRRAIAQIEEHRAELELDTLKPWLLAQQRRPFEDLFAILVDQHRAADALAIVQRVTARSTLDGMIGAPRPATSIGDRLDRAGDRVAGLRALAHSLRASPAAPPLDADALIAGIADRYVATYFRAGGALYLIVAGDGAARVFELGDAARIRDRVAAWTAAPDRAPLADELGALLVPAGALPARGRRLYVAVDDLVRDVPFAALRVDGAYLIERDPIAYVPSASVLVVMSAAAPAPIGGGDGATIVLGDPTGDLPAARQEAAEVARAMGVAPRVGAAATRDAILGASGVRLLHVAAHAGETPLGAALRLADGWVGAGDVIERGFAARVVVMTACTSADARDRDELGPLANAFLAAGTRVVVASRWAVSDDVARRFAREFYAADGVAHPVEAAAAAQRALQAGGDPPSAWATFVVVGTEASPIAAKERKR